MIQFCYIYHRWLINGHRYLEKLHNIFLLSNESALERTIFCWSISAMNQQKINDVSTNNQQCFKSSKVELKIYYDEKFP